MSPTWYVYFLRCADGTLYAGVTTDVVRRVAEHNEGKLGARYTRARRPVQLCYVEQAEDRAAAQRREAALRRLTRAAKEALVADGGIQSLFSPRA